MPVSLLLTHGMVDSEFSLDKGLLFIFIACLFAIPLFMLATAVSFVETLFIVAFVLFLSGVNTSTILNIIFLFKTILTTKTLCGKSGGDDGWIFSSPSGDKDFLLFCFIPISKIIDCSLFSGAYYV
jgi:hypothetical protein